MLWNAIGSDNSTYHLIINKFKVYIKLAYKFNVSFTGCLKTNFQYTNPL